MNAHRFSVLALVGTLLGAWALAMSACRSGQGLRGAGSTPIHMQATRSTQDTAAAVDNAGAVTFDPFDCGCDQPASPVLDPNKVPVDVSLNEISACESPPPAQRSCQSCFDCFGWQLFIGMNWPAGQRGLPDPSKPFGLPGDFSPVVWETFADGHGVFSQKHLPLWDTDSTDKILTTTSLRSKQADNNWLTDRDGNLVRYEIRINRDLYEYIRVNQLNTRAGLSAAFKTGSGLALPSGAGGGVGTIEIKAAWRIVPDGRIEEFKPRYKLSKAKIDGVERTVALIGLHIAKKTPKLHQWAWATFEHEANAPAEGAAPGGQLYNLFDAGLPADYQPNYNHPPDPHGTPPTSMDRPVQVRRAVPMGTAAERLNDHMQRLIASRYPQSVFRHYRLVDVQWPLKPMPIAPKLTKPPPDGDPRPKVVANITMETYMQHQNSGGGAGMGGAGTTPVEPENMGKSSCIACHRLSSVTPEFPGTSDKWHTDYSTLFFNAK